ncbi:hypothetical protein [Thalassomonas actiniarum]|uniref:Uncharacterized protein n=1 Tax=Thalassomonas actiniarum TaxID=485447 RepID=A0AAE9YQD7_9GAMM|nr:hypothetical protein [Thalassomonas actiniarum]WDD99290.1 hypothetical protein SG35_000960 [Thalassomonas actiniarum]
MSGLTSLRQIKSASPLGSLLSLGYKQIVTKNNAEEVYRSLVPLLHEQIKIGRTIDDPMIQNAQKVLEGLAPFGVRRRNFKRWYLGSNTKLLELPHDPDKLTIACWW